MGPEFCALGHRWDGDGSHGNPGHEDDFMIRSWPDHVARLQLEQSKREMRDKSSIIRRHLTKGFPPTQGGFMAVATQSAQGSEIETTRTLVEARDERAIELPESMWQRIAAKAYALYEERGCREGYAVQDWLDAEYIVNDEIYETH